MSEGGALRARSRIRIFAPEQFFGYFLFAQKVTRPEGRNPLLRVRVDAPKFLAGLPADTGE